MKLLHIIGARPQFIKASTVSQALKEHNSKRRRPFIVEILVHTGQHYDYHMNRIFFEQLDLPEPHYTLGVREERHGAMTGLMLARIEEVLLKESPDWVIAYGDTNSTIAGVLAAVKLGVPVAHVEAGLRSFDRQMPEEVNRVVTDHVSTLLFCPTETAIENLKREGITEGVYMVGDTMYQALRQYISLAESRSTILERLHLQPGCYLLATLHRAENTDRPERLDPILRGFLELAETGNKVVFPVHPRTRKRMAMITAEVPPGGLIMIDPVSYLDMLVLEKNARAILTDSGGVQKEAYWLGIPCITLREQTEWIETLEDGRNTLVGSDKERIIEAVERLQETAPSPPAPSVPSSAAENILHILLGSHLQISING